MVGRCEGEGHGKDSSLATGTLTGAILDHTAIRIKFEAVLQ